MDNSVYVLRPRSLLSLGLGNGFTMVQQGQQKRRIMETAMVPQP